MAQQLPHVDLAPACPQITQQPRPSQHPGSAHPMHASYADTASGSSSQGQPSRQKTAQRKEPSQAAKRQRCEATSDVSTEDPSELGPSDPQSTAPEQQSAGVPPCNEGTSGAALDGAGGMSARGRLKQAVGPMSKPAKMTEIGRSNILSGMPANRKATGASGDDSSQFKSCIPCLQSDLFVCHQMFRTLTLIAEPSATTQ